ncbi:MAG: phosphoenolpyruvate carboxykinase (ATP) [Nanoarchaeota archaeon]|nr:phosphoenolpyruvate carboxykinase (ATP) [Nanoarchaeota archaeon]
MAHDLSTAGITGPELQWNLSNDQLKLLAIRNKEGTAHKSGALTIYTGKYTGRSPKDRFIVDTTPDVHWGDVNLPFPEAKYKSLQKEVAEYLSKKPELFIIDGFAGADLEHAQRIRVVCERPSHALFIKHLLRRQTHLHEKPDITILCAPGFLAKPESHGTRSEAFIILHPKDGTVLIGGTEYCGEIKKSVFSLMNYLLPLKGVLTLHASVNVGKKNDPAVFFGLSGTGKTTLSSDPNRKLIGDDEHGWSDKTLFNIEGGIYAKCIGLTQEREPLIFDGIKHGAVVENVVVKDGEYDFHDASLTENTRVGIPLEHLSNVETLGTTTHPRTIIFLTLDAFGVLPPVSRLNADQAVYHFMSGYTSKVAGTERGITEPKATFSFAFGEAFMPLAPLVYAKLLGEKVRKHACNVFLVNTGWTGGPFGVGKRMKLADTRRIVTAVLEGELDTGGYRNDPIFNVEVPLLCPGVDTTILNPSETWPNKEAYLKKAHELAGMFKQNFKRFKDAPEHLVKAGPQ